MPCPSPAMNLNPRTRRGGLSLDIFTATQRKSFQNRVESIRPVHSPWTEMTLFNDVIWSRTAPTPTLAARVVDFEDPAHTSNKLPVTPCLLRACSSLYFLGASVFSWPRGLKSMPTKIGLLRSTVKIEIVTHGRIITWKCARREHPAVAIELINL